MKLIFSDADSRSYEREIKKPITVEASTAEDGSIVLTVSAGGKLWLRISASEDAASAIGHALLAACQNVKTTSTTGAK